MQHLYCLIIFFFSKSVLSENPSVIIVGAGPSGIAAACRLLENSVTNLKILEAENRIGGRINSVEFGGAFVDIGAQYCSGEKENIVYELVKDLDILQHSTLSTDYVEFYYSNGSAIPNDLAEDFLTHLINYDDNITFSENTTLKDAFLEKYNSSVIDKYRNDEEKLKLTVDAIKFLHEGILTNEGAFSWEKISAGQHGVICEGDQGMTWKSGGYHTILKVLMKTYPNSERKLEFDDKIFLEKKVNKIIWDDSKVKVHTSDNSTLTADHVIFTPSLGVLKKHKDEIFKPRLPLEKQKAIEALGFDGVMKIILYFHKIWWNNYEAFLFIWDRNDLSKVTEEFPDGPKKDGISWIAYIPYITKVTANPNVLIAWVSSDIISELEQVSEEILMRGSMHLIRRFLGKDFNVTNADKIIRSQWVTNPNFLGTYSYEKVGYYKEDTFYPNLLSKPLYNKNGIPSLLFAGEATHPIRYGMVHGAIETGRREADRIINLYK